MKSCNSYIVSNYTILMGLMFELCIDDRTYDSSLELSCPLWLGISQLGFILTFSEGNPLILTFTTKKVQKRYKKGTKNALIFLDTGSWQYPTMWRVPDLKLHTYTLNDVES